MRTSAGGSNNSKRPRVIEASRIGSETAPRDITSIAPRSSRSQVTFVGSLSSLLAPTEPSPHNEAWTRRDSNPHLRPSRGAVFPLHHGPKHTLRGTRPKSMFEHHTPSKIVPKREGRYWTAARVRLQPLFALMNEKSRAAAPSRSLTPLAHL